MVRFQFGIRAILAVTFSIAFIMAVVAQTGSLVSSILLTVLLANFTGAIVALIVTFVLRFPRDGLLRDPDSSLDNDLGHTGHDLGESDGFRH